MLHQNYETDAPIDKTSLQFHNNVIPVHSNIIPSEVNFTNKPRTQITTDAILSFLDCFKQKVMNLKLQDQQLNKIFELSEDLVRQTNQLNLNLMIDDTELKPVQVMETSTQFICAQLCQLRSTFKRKKMYSRKAHHVQPKEMAIGTRWELKKFRRINKLTRTTKIIKIPRMIQCSFQYVSILETLKSLFGQDEFMQMYFDFNIGANRHQCHDGQFKSFCCGEIFKNSCFFQRNPEAIQIQLAWDDFEICSPLKTKANLYKICGIYFTIRNVPAKYLSKLTNIHVVALINSNDLKTKQTDMNNIWYPIVQEIRSLEMNGLELKNGSSIKGTLIQCVSDNLGANTGLGFSAGFAKGPYFCRICFCHKEECDQLTVEDSTKIRTKSDYNHQIHTIAGSSKLCMKATKGVKYYCQLSDLEHYHILDNPTADIMHDFNEGAIPYVLTKLFTYIFKTKILSEEILNSMIQFFDFGLLNQRNAPSEIKMDKRSLGQNAAQSRCLLTYLPFILYEYLDNPKLKLVWGLVESLLRISETIYSSTLKESDCQELGLNTTNLLEQIQRQFNSNFIPKLHFMLHYPYIIRKCGPLVHINMFRFESKHKQLKDFTEGCKNFRNINKTIATRHQQWSTEQGFTYKDKITHSTLFPIKKEFLSQNKEFFDQFQLQIEHIHEITTFEFNSFKYFKNIFVTFKKTVFEIQTIFFDCKTQLAYFLCKKFKIISFEKYLNSFQVEEDYEVGNTMVCFDSIDNIKPYSCVDIDSRHFIVSDTLDLRNSLLF